MSTCDGKQHTGAQLTASCASHLLSLLYKSFHGGVQLHGGCQALLQLISNLYGADAQGILSAALLQSLLEQIKFHRLPSLLIQLLAQYLPLSYHGLGYDKGTQSAHGASLCQA